MMIALYLVEHGFTRGLDALFSIFLIRQLPLNWLGALVTYQSWVAIILIFFPAFEVLYYRNYAQYLKQNTLSQQIAVFIKINQLKLVSLILIALALSGLPLKDLPYSLKLAALLLALALPFSQALYGVFRESLRFEQQQTKVVYITLAQKIGLIASVAVLYWLQQPLIFIGSALSILLLFYFVWQRTAHKTIAAFQTLPPTALSSLYQKILYDFKDSVLWIHLVGASMAAVQSLDVYFLAKNSTINLEQLALYSLALKAANFFQIIPLAITQALGVWLGRNPKNSQQEFKTVHQTFLVFLICALLVWLFAQGLALPFLSFLAHHRFNDQALTLAQNYFNAILVGVLLQTLAFAHGTFLTSRSSVQPLFMKVFLPWSLLSILIYAAAARQGLAATASSNIIVGALYCLGQLVFYYRYRRAIS